MRAIIVLSYIGLLGFVAVVHCKSLSYQELIQALKNVEDSSHKSGSKQVFLAAQGKESTSADFFRLVAMRLIYGIASTMGLEDRLEDVFNGVFVPAGAQDDLFGFGGTDGGDGVDLGDIFDP